MDQSWMSKSKRDTTYQDGVEQFLAFAYQNFPRDSYSTWVHHGENYESLSFAFVDLPNNTSVPRAATVYDHQHGGLDDMQELLQAAFSRA
ncbi:hypothetical protein BS78_07G014200, partial [Paspalum vaginatum]